MLLDHWDEVRFRGVDAVFADPDLVLHLAEHG
jgi:hypothetical protein